MIHATGRCWLRTDVRRIAILLAALVTAVTLRAEPSAGCNRAQAIVDEVKALLAAPQPDHRAILGKLRTAQQLCPTLGAAWKYAHCSALAIGDEQSARLYRDRAVFNGVSDVRCDGSAAAPPPPAPLPSYVRQKFALVVGVGTFLDTTIPRLQYAAKDARDFAAALKNPRYGNFAPDNVTLLVDEQATRAAILNAMQDLFLRARGEDMVVLYVSSHGSPAQQERGLGGIGYIVTYDTSVKNIWVDAIEYQDFAQKASMIPARRKVVFLDTCFSGEASRAGEKALAIEGLGVDERTAKMFLSGEGTFVITSSKSNERSWESDTLQNSYFTHYLLEALSRRAEPPTVREIFEYISGKVTDAVARDKRAPQHPQIQPVNGPGDVRIGVVPKPSTP